MNQDLIAQLSDEQFHDLMTSLRDPDLASVMGAAKKVFPAFIRGIVEPRVSSTVVRTEALEASDVIELYNELAVIVRVLCSVKASLPHTGVVDWVRMTCAHFFWHTKYGLRDLYSKSYLLPPELGYEVEALKVLAGYLTEYFEGLDLLRRDSAVESLRDKVLYWARRWYPAWNLISHDIEAGERYYGLVVIDDHSGEGA